MLKLTSFTILINILKLPTLLLYNLIYNILIPLAYLCQSIYLYNLYYRLYYYRRVRALADRKSRYYQLESVKRQVVSTERRKEYIQRKKLSDYRLCLSC